MVVGWALSRSSGSKGQIHRLKGLPNANVTSALSQHQQPEVTHNQHSTGLQKKTKRSTKKWCKHQEVAEKS